MVFDFKDKRGMLLAEETLKTVLAVIVISVLVYFLVSLYFSNSGNQELKMAESTMSNIEEAIASDNVSKVNAVQPSSWYLFSFTEGVKPNQCAGDSCICICQESGIWSNNFDENPQAKQCSSEGACSNVENLNDFGKIEFKSASEGLTNLKISKSDGKVVIEEVE